MVGGELPHPVVVGPAEERSLGSAGEDLAPELGRRAGELPAGMVVVEQTAPADPAWHFAVAVAEDSELCGPALVESSLEDPTQSLGIFRRSKPEADVEIISHILEYEIDPADWLERALENDGRQIRSSKHHQLLAGRAGDVVATWTLDDEAFAGRFVATKWGPRLFVVCCRTRLAHYGELAEQFLGSAASFEPLDDSFGSFAEPVHFVAEATPCEWKATVPDSWSVQRHPVADEGAWFDALHQAPSRADEQTGEVDGRLTMAVMARSVAARPRDAGNVLLRALRDNDIQLEHAAFERNDEPLPCCRSEYRHSWSLTTPVTRQGVAGELRCRVLMHQAVWVVAAVLGPIRDDDDEAWMRNKRVLDLTTCTLELTP